MSDRLSPAILAARAARQADSAPAADLFIRSMPNAGEYRTDRPLTEKYRPIRLAQLVGQAQAVAILQSYAAHPYPTAFILDGATGTGKTSAALALANELGCDVGKDELGGVWQIASGEQSVSNVRDLLGRLHFVPFYGSGWRVCIINEADQMAPQAETVWLDALEHLPPRTCIVFTTNNPAKLSDRFKDRCQSLAFASKPSDAVRDAVRELVRRICREELGDADAITAEQVADGLVRDGAISYRRVVQNISRALHAARQVA